MMPFVRRRAIDFQVVCTAAVCASVVATSEHVPFGSQRAEFEERRIHDIRCAADGPLRHLEEKLDREGTAGKLRRTRDVHSRTVARAVRREVHRGRIHERIGSNRVAAQFRRHRLAGRNLRRIPVVNVHPLREQIRIERGIEHRRFRRNARGGVKSRTEPRTFVEREINSGVLVNRVLPALGDRTQELFLRQRRVADAHLRDVPWE